MNLFDKILTRDEFIANPPVLVDIGASGVIHESWKTIAKHSICIAFDADDRDFKIESTDNKGFKKLHVFNCIVTDKEESSCEFFLTKSPYCSSALKPLSEYLKLWAFADKFDVTGKAHLKNISLKSAVDNLKLDRIDWFKSDSQGIDFRLFKNVYEKLPNKIIVAEFEPGLIDSYSGEDKISKILEFMSKEGFLLSDMTVKGSQRITRENLASFSSSYKMQNLIHYSQKSSPGWAEITYISEVTRLNTIREFLITWIFASILKQYGLALEIALIGKTNFKDSIFDEMIKNSRSAIKFGFYKLKFFSAIIEKLSKTFTH